MPDYKKLRSTFEKAQTLFQRGEYCNSGHRCLISFLAKRFPDHSSYDKAWLYLELVFGEPSVGLCNECSHCELWSNA